MSACAVRDAAGRLETETWYTANGQVQDTLKYVYNEDNSLKLASNANGTYAFGYDTAGMLQTVSEPFGAQLTFTYDDAGNRETVSDNYGGVTTSKYNEDNQLASRSLATGSGEIKVDFGYTDRGELDTVTREYDVVDFGSVGQLAATTKYRYDEGGRIKSIATTSAADTLLSNYSYISDDLGRITKMTIDGKDSSYDYDNIGQVKSDNGSGIDYDANGNRTSGGTTPIAGNRLLTDGVWTYGYDNAGNVVSRSKTGEAWTYKYNVGGQMTEASNGSTTVNYAYDVFGNRIARTVSTGAGSSVERYAVDGWDTAKPSAVGTENFDTWADLTADGKGGWMVATRRLFGAGQDQVLARESASGDVAWYGTDQLGSVRLVFDNSGTVVGKADYSAFGATTMVVAAGMDRYQFTGREYDNALMLQYSRARLYELVSGRFFGEDPLGFAAGDPNLSRYVTNGATTKRDPSGMDDLDDQIAKAKASKIRRETESRLRQELTIYNLNESQGAPLTVEQKQRKAAIKEELRNLDAHEPEGAILGFGFAPLITKPDSSAYEDKIKKTYEMAKKQYEIDYNSYLNDIREGKIAIDDNVHYKFLKQTSMNCWLAATLSAYAFHHPHDL